MQRMKVVLGHLGGGGGQPRTSPCLGLSGSPRSVAVGNPEDVVVVHGRRTPIGKSKRGGLKDTTPDELLAAVMTAVLKDLNLSPEKLGDICVGNVLQPGAGALTARIGQFLSGIPETVPISCVNRQCSSGLQAVINIAGGIRNGSYDIGLACGVESMSLRSVGDPGDLSSRMVDNSKARDCLIPMGITSENVAERFGVSRKKQDAFALASQQKAARAQQMGWFKNEIVPVTTTFTDDQGNEKKITVLQDEGIRPSTTLEGLAKLKPAFKENGTTTAGNSSQVSDGAAAVLLAKRSKASQLHLPVLGVLKSYAVVGVPPDVMGIGPAYAIPVALEKAGLTVNDIDIFEINEAFASQAVYCVEKLGIPLEKVNPLGGAIALGHPLGCTGARQVVTLLHELQRRGKRGYGVVSMCIGTGMGAAAVFEYPGN
ncbi:3-ketoacyl-CoA thiolase, peroxisomal isoform X1 [Hemicordylus capensis]|uniref:3-ketoacyl-CoA thiolase, peroxisomal isoform X1 n=1 Tax=Hemicordylus capensis TaxID=884348 RepID=UPI0023024732|nr:3-ketoacyl-CoA thiolase, peroxisomal isoform X1 [Hemicordylus capensis]